MRIFPFRGWRPLKEKAAHIISHPYDVISRDEAKAEADKNPISFYHINRAEVDLPADMNPYHENVYQKAAENLQAFKQQGLFFRDSEPLLYLYEQEMGEHHQLGLVATCHIEDYIQQRILKHELTRQDKEADRTRHIVVTGHNTGAVFLFYKHQPKLGEYLAELSRQMTPEYDIVTHDGIHHIFWVIRDQASIRKIRVMAEEIDTFYIADGHHRAASSINSALHFQKLDVQPDEHKDYLRFLTIIFPAAQLQILDYNRVVTDLNHLEPEEFVKRIEESFRIELIAPNHPEKFKPQQRHQMAMYLEKKWYHLFPKAGNFNEEDVLQSLDVNILYNYILHPILGIGDPRTDKRIDFVGGIRGLTELVNLVDNHSAKVAFAMYPTSIQELMKVSDDGLLMPPKSTWFEPKLGSGLIMHQMV